MEKFEGETPLGRPTCRWVNNTKRDVAGIGWGYCLDCYGSGYGQVESSCECGNEPPVSIKFWEVFEWLHNKGLTRRLVKEGAPQRQDSNFQTATHFVDFFFYIHKNSRVF
jgi:hypothetical protein